MEVVISTNVSTRVQALKSPENYKIVMIRSCCGQCQTTKICWSGQILLVMVTKWLSGGLGVL